MLPRRARLVTRSPCHVDGAAATAAPSSWWAYAFPDRLFEVYQTRPAAATPAPTTVAETTGCSGRIPASRSRSGTALENVSIGQPRSFALLRRARSGLTTFGRPTAWSPGP